MMHELFVIYNDTTVYFTKIFMGCRVMHNLTQKGRITNNKVSSIRHLEKVKLTYIKVFKSPFQQ